MSEPTAVVVGAGAVNSAIKKYEVQSPRDIRREEIRSGSQRAVTAESQRDTAISFGSINGNNGAGKFAPSDEAIQDPNHRKKYLTPEERRALRRQIRDVGSEMYSPAKN